MNGIVLDKRTPQLFSINAYSINIDGLIVRIKDISKLIIFYILIHSIPVQGIPFRILGWVDLISVFLRTKWLSLILSIS